MTAKGFVDKTDRALIGLRNFHYSKLLLDRPDSIIYGDMVEFPNTISLEVNANAATETLYADNKPAIVYSTIGNVDVTITKTYFPEHIKAEWLGSPTVGGVRHVTSTQTSPYLGIAWEQTYSDGLCSYVKLFKGKFSEPSTTANTKEASISFQTGTMTGQFAATSYQEPNVGGKPFPLLMAIADETNPAYKSEGDTWFDSIHETVAAAWKTATKYATGAVVKEGAKYHECISAHTSAAAFATDAAKWKEIKV